MPHLYYNSSLGVNFPEPSEEEFEYCAAIFKGVKGGIANLADLIIHPIDNLLYPVVGVLYDATIILAAHQNHLFDDKDLVEYLTKQDAYRAALGRMRQRVLHLKHVAECFLNPSSPKNIEVVAENISTILVPGYFFRGIKGVAQFVKSNPIGETFSVANEFLTSISQSIPLSDSIRFKLLDSPSFESGIGQKSYLYAMTQQNKLLIAENAATLAELSEEFSHIFLHIHELSHIQPTIASGVFESRANEIIQIDNFSTLSSRDTNLPDAVEQVFKKYGFTSTKGKFQSNFSSSMKMGLNMNYLYPAALFSYSTQNPNIVPSSLQDSEESQKLFEFSLQEFSESYSQQLTSFLLDEDVSRYKKNANYGAILGHLSNAAGLFALSSPETTRFITSTAQSLSLFGSSWCTLSALNFSAFSLTGTALPALGALGCAVMAISNLLSLFEDDDKEDAFAAYLINMLQEIYQELHRLRIEIREIKTIVQRIEIKFDLFYQNFSYYLTALQEENKSLHRSTHDAISYAETILGTLLEISKSAPRESLAREIVETVQNYLNHPGIPNDETLITYIREFTTHTQSKSKTPLLAGAITTAAAEAHEWSLEQKCTAYAGYYINDILGFLQSRKFLPQFSALPNPILWSYSALALTNLFNLVYNKDERCISQDEFARIEALQKEGRQLSDFFTALRSPTLVDIFFDDLKRAYTDVAKFIEAFASAQLSKLSQERLAKRTQNKQTQTLQIIDKVNKIDANSIVSNSAYADLGGREPNPSVLIETYKKNINSFKESLLSIIEKNQSSTSLLPFVIEPEEEGLPVLILDMDLACYLGLNPIFLEALEHNLIKIVFKYEINEKGLIFNCYIPHDGTIQCIGRYLFVVNFNDFHNDPIKSMTDRRAAVRAIVEEGDSESKKEKILLCKGVRHGLTPISYYWLITYPSWFHNQNAFKVLWAWTGGYKTFPNTLSYSRPSEIPAERYSNGLYREFLEHSAKWIEITEDLSVREKIKAEVQHLIRLTKHKEKNEMISLLRVNILPHKSIKELDAAYKRLQAFLMLSFYDLFESSHPNVALFKGMFNAVCSIKTLLNFLEDLESNQTATFNDLMHHLNSIPHFLEIIRNYLNAHTTEKELDHTMFESVFKTIHNTHSLHQKHVSETSQLVRCSKKQHMEQGENPYKEMYEKSAHELLGIFSSTLNAIPSSEIKAQCIATFNHQIKEKYGKECRFYLDSEGNVAERKTPSLAEKLAFLGGSPLHRKLSKTESLTKVNIPQGSSTP